MEKKTAHAAEQDRTEVKAEHEAWFAGQLDLDPGRLIFIDQTAGAPKKILYDKLWKHELNAQRPEWCKSSY